jgi:hypothetical protein
MFMKKIYLSFVLACVVSLWAMAAAPTATGSNLTYNNLDGKGFYGFFTKGNGANRIVVMKEGSPVMGLPVNGKDYNASTKFGTAGSEFSEVGEFVVAKTGWESFEAQNLKPGTTYYIAIFEYNGSGAGTEYRMLPLTGSQSTVVAPTVQPSAFTSTTATGNTITLSFAKGDGMGRIIIARKGAAVNATPVDLTSYATDDVFGSSYAKMGVDNYAVYKGNGTSVVVKGLEPNTTYHFVAFEYNGNNAPMYLAFGTTTFATTNAGPTIQARSIGFNWVEGNSFTASVSVGNGTNRLFIAHKGAAVTAVPVNGTTYTANGSFGSGYEIGPGEFVVGATAGTSVSITNLEAGTDYHLRVFEYDVDKAGNTYYLTTDPAIKIGSTQGTPTTLASNIKLVTLTGSSATISLTNGSGSYRTVLMKEGSPVDAAPVNFKTYTANAAFGSGSQLGTGNFVITWSMNGSQFTATSLQPGKTYHIAVYEFNGNGAPVYSTTAATFSFTVPLEPTASATRPFFQSIEGASMRIGWEKGNGAKRIMIAKKGSAPTAKPVDGTSYTASNNFGVGDQIGPGEFVVYNGDYYYFDLYKLESNATYHYAIYEYNEDENGNEDYLVTSWLATSASTKGAPTTQPTIQSVSNIQAAQATINYTRGNGDGTLFLLKEGSPVDKLPQDLVKYSYNGAYGTSSVHMGDGNYVVFNSSFSGNFNVSSLKPKTTYYISAFEYGGSAEPVYLKTWPATTSFTTTDVPGATVPTSAATNGSVVEVDGNKFKFKWTNGDGEKRIVIMRRGSAVDFTPASATVYAANAAFGSGTDLGNGQYVVYNGNGTSVDVTGLQPSTAYYFTVYEYNGTASLLRYLTAAKLTASGSTAVAPATTVSNVNNVIGTSSVTLSWTAGSGNGRLIVMKEGAATTSQPVDLSVYPAGNVFTHGSQMEAGEYVVYAGTGNAVTITGLQNKTYHYSIFEYNGTAAPVYNTATVVKGSVVISSTLPVNLASFTAKATNGAVLLNWATLQELNSSRFVVERSFDAHRFEAIGTVQGAGSSAERKEYSYTDKALTGADRIYYRLKQVDNDGKFVYSTVQVISTKTTGSEISIYPNPVVSAFRVSLPTGVKVAQLSVYDIRGSVVMNRKVAEGQVIDASALTAGTYLVLIEQNGKKSYSKLVK